MGTFHDDLGPLHGITIVVDTTGPKLVVGRCHEITEEAVHLVGADVFDEEERGLAKAEYLKEVAAVGFWEKHPRLSVDRRQVASIRPLGEV